MTRSSPDHAASSDMTKIKTEVLNQPTAKSLTSSPIDLRRHLPLPSEDRSKEDLNSVQYHNVSACIKTMVITANTTTFSTGDLK